MCVYASPWLRIELHGGDNVGQAFVHYRLISPWACGTQPHLLRDRITSRAAVPVINKISVVRPVNAAKLDASFSRLLNIQPTLSLSVVGKRSRRLVTITANVIVAPTAARAINGRS